MNTETDGINTVYDNPYQNTYIPLKSHDRTVTSLFPRDRNQTARRSELAVIKSSMNKPPRKYKGFEYLGHSGERI